MPKLEQVSSTISTYSLQQKPSTSKHCIVLLTGQANGNALPKYLPDTFTLSLWPGLDNVYMFWFGSINANSKLEASKNINLKYYRNNESTADP